MNRVVRAVVYGIASGLVAVVITVVLLGLMYNWENVHRPTFIREELAWFGVFSILNGLSTYYHDKQPAAHKKTGT